MKIISTEEYNQIVDCMNNANEVLKKLKLENDKLKKELEVAKNLHKPLVGGSLPHDSQIDAALDKLLIIRGEHPARVRNPLYGEERELAKDLLKYILLSVDCRNRTT